MASLTQTAIIARKIIRYSFYGLVTIIVLRFTFILGSRVYRNIFPEPPPEPTVTFGTIPAITFPDRLGYEGLTFILETPEGGLPSLAEQAPVYFMPKAAANIQSLERTKQKAVSLKFNQDGRALTETIYLFNHPSAPQTLNMNIVTQGFSINYDLQADPSVIGRVPPTPEVAIAQAKSYIATAGLLPDDISGPETHEFIKIRNGVFTGALSLSESDMIKVNLFRKNYNEFPSLTANPKQANIWFIIGSTSRRGAQVIAAEYLYFPIDETQSATYPLKNSQEAWDELKTGQGFIASLGNNTTTSEIKIRRVYLAYYDAGVYLPFYQPIVVFEGDNDFFAYVPAVANQYYGATQE